MTHVCSLVNIHLWLHHLVARVVCGVKRRDKDRVATSPFSYLLVVSMWLQNGNLEGLGSITFQICWLLWGVAKEISPQEIFLGVCLSVHAVY